MDIESEQTMCICEGGVWGRAEAPYKADSDAAMSASNAGLGAIHLVRPHRGG